jgi:hypothetical protein
LESLTDINKNKSPIRKLSKEEQAKGRAWPSKKHLSSENEMALPKPGEKNRVHSVLTALPFLMLVIGLVFYFRGESAQNNGALILDQRVELLGEYKGLSKVSGIGTTKHFLWLVTDKGDRGVRIKPEQLAQVRTLQTGDAIQLQAAPTVEGSQSVWVYSVKHDSVELLPQ